MPIEAAPTGALLNEGLCKQLIKEFYRRVKGGEKMGVVLHALLHTVYAHGVTAGQQRAK
jgi:hypothetical protein